MFILGYCICAVHIATGDFNLVVWRLWLQSANLMYANTTYNHVYYEATYTQCRPEISANVQIIMFQFPKLIVRQIYHVSPIIIIVNHVIRKSLFGAQEF